MFKVAVRPFLALVAAMLLSVAVAGSALTERRIHRANRGRVRIGAAVARTASL
jgi:hypothetical protein